MHDIEPHYNWRKYYIAEEDERSPFFGKEYSEIYFTHDIYGYYIHPQWDYIGSETLYLKLLYIDYEHSYAIIEVFGEWNDCLHNDCMHFKRNFLDHLLQENINKFILIGENVFNFHGGEDDDYYSEWFEEIEEGWIVTLGFRSHVIEEWKRYGIDCYFNFGGALEIANWRAWQPDFFFREISELVSKRLTI